MPHEPEDNMYISPWKSLQTSHPVVIRRLPLVWQCNSLGDALLQTLNRVCCLCVLCSIQKLGRVTRRIATPSRGARPLNRKSGDLSGLPDSSAIQYSKFDQT